MSGHLSRRFTFRVRPHHRETLASYTTRLLAANFEPETLRGDLVRESGHSTGGPKTDDAAIWLDILTAKTGRQLHVSADPSGWSTHPDGSACAACIDLIPTRWLCTRCAHSTTVEQHPHFDTPVCLRHHRWVGIRTDPTDQVQVGRTHHAAARNFARLRRAHRLDVRLYLMLHESLAGGHGTHTTEADVFPAVVKLAAAITSKNFLSTFLDPTTSFVETHAYLRGVIGETLGRPHPRATRAIWLHMRPTVATYRQAHHEGLPFQPATAHDFPVAISILAYRNSDESEPFSEYLHASRDTPATAFEHVVDSYRGWRSSSDTQETQTCDQGHQYSSVPAARGQKPAGCPACTNRAPATGSDLQTIAPDVAAELDPARNGGLSARDVPARSGRKLFWLCPTGHSYPATPNNRTLNGSLCPVCTKRLIVPGINDLATSHPQLAAEFHPSELATQPPTELAAGTNTKVIWLCPAGHTYRMPVIERVGGRYCPTCTRADARAAALTLQESHPHIAQEWHPTRNYGRTANDRTHGSKVLAWWLCANGHSYSQRIERRTAAGYGCPVCSKRKLASGTNDLASTEPVLTLEWHPTRNKRAAADTMSIDKLFYWRCLANGHEHPQTVDHRRKSLGCPLCPREQRLLVSHKGAPANA